MSPPALALAAATCYSVSQLAVRLGTRRLSPFGGLVVSLYAGTVMLGAAVAVRGFGSPDPLAFAVFALAGLLGPGLARFASITSVSRIGATRTVPIIAAFHPLISGTLGAVLLAERLTPLRVAGVLMMLGGIWLAVRATRQPVSAEVMASGVRVSFLLLPFLAGSAYGIADYVRKQGLAMLADPLAGAFVGIAMSALIWSVVLVARGDGRSVLGRLSDRDVRWFALSGILSAIAQLFLFWALLDGDLTVVAPIVASQPVIVALLVRMFINRIEPVGPSVGLAAVFAAGGTALLAL